MSDVARRQDRWRDLDRHDLGCELAGGLPARIMLCSSHVISSRCRTARRRPRCSCARATARAAAPRSGRGLSLQIPPSPIRPHFVKVRVRVHDYPDGTLAIFHGPRCLARYRGDGRPLDHDACWPPDAAGRPPCGLCGQRFALPLQPPQAPPPQRSTHVLPGPVNLTCS
jgi:hypothetical protein